MEGVRAENRAHRDHGPEAMIHDYPTARHLGIANTIARAADIIGS